MSKNNIQYANTVKDSNNTFGYQPTKSSSNTPSHTPVQTSSPPKKP
jgi:hypothetical protein